MNPDGSGQKRLTGRSGDDWPSVFSPDGTLTAFTQVSATIWSMKADGTKLRELTAGIVLVRDQHVDRGNRAGTQEAPVDLGPLARGFG
jgi:hypothetical protein